MSEPVSSEGTEIVGRYALHGEIASGGMAVVYFGKLLGPVGFSRPVAIKRLQRSFARDPGLRHGFIDEARLASRIRHPNVVPTLDVVDERDELLLVMEYVHGESLQELLRAMRARGERVPLRIVLAIMTGILHGLHAAHEATTETGEPLRIVHRDVSPQNVLCGVDGVPRVLDFGVARAAVRHTESTGEGIVKGKLAYMAPEQLGGAPVDRRADIYAASVILWEMLAGRRLFVRDDGATVLLDKLLHGTIEAPSTHASSVPRLLDAITLHGLTRNSEQRFATAREMAMALEKFGDLARPSEVGEWVERLAAEPLATRKDRLKELEMTSSTFRVDRLRDLPSPALLEPSIDHLIDVDAEDGEGLDEDSAPTRVLGASRSSMPSPHAVSIPPARALGAARSGSRPRRRVRPLFVFAAYALLGASNRARGAHAAPGAAVRRLGVRRGRGAGGEHRGRDGPGRADPSEGIQQDTRLGSRDSAPLKSSISVSPARTPRAGAIARTGPTPRLCRRASRTEACRGWARCVWRSGWHGRARTPRAPLRRSR